MKLCLLAILLVAVFIFWPFGSGGSNAESGSPLMERARGAFSLEPRDNYDGAALENFPHAATAVPVSEITDTQYLKLVNRDRAIQTPISSARLV